MSVRQFYSDPARIYESTTLPDCEVWYCGPAEAADEATSGPREPGWYWWPCFPGCLLDGDPVGPFDSEAEAIADAQGDAQ